MLVHKIFKSHPNGVNTMVFPKYDLNVRKKQNPSIHILYDNTYEHKIGENFDGNVTLLNAVVRRLISKNMYDHI